MESFFFHLSFGWNALRNISDFNRRPLHKYIHERFDASNYHKNIANEQNNPISNLRSLNIVIEFYEMDTSIVINTNVRVNVVYMCSVHCSSWIQTDEIKRHIHTCQIHNFPSQFAHSLSISLASYTEKCRETTTVLPYLRQGVCYLFHLPGFI